MLIIMHYVKINVSTIQLFFLFKMMAIYKNSGNKSNLTNEIRYDGDSDTNTTVTSDAVKNFQEQIYEQHTYMYTT